MLKRLGCGLVGWCLILIGIGGASAPSYGADAQAMPRRVKVLFLGDNGHHVPLERCRDVYTVLGIRGIDLTYTDDLNDLNPQTLGRYDVLLLYANWTSISPSQEKALLDYVESGHGFAPIHCASFCFLNSPKITALIGARFKSHNTGIFEETIVKPDHPIEKGLKPIKSWDETYVHEMHNEKDREVLAYRVEGDHKEPYTWTRTQGKGRVFYTAWGHDERTWGNPDFQNLLERGIRWAAGDWALEPQPATNDFQYTEAKIPEYVKGAAWGTANVGVRKMQLPIDPQESMKHMVVPPGFSVKRFASDPRIYKPICMTWDERGRLFIAETLDYPNARQKPGEGHDRIVICDDTNGDGVADKFTVFADKLSLPTSMCFANGGLIVSQMPDMLFLKDTQGTGVADERKVLFTGWGTQDTHAGPSNLRRGFDGWIYGTVGYSSFRGEVGGQPVSFGQGIYRFKPDGSKLEFLGSTNNNTWGLGISEDNQVFASTANGFPSFYLSIPNRYYEQVEGMSARGSVPIADTPHFYPVTDKIRQVDYFGSYTAGAGSALYTARSFPANYWNRVAFVAEPTGHLLGQFILQPKGAGFAARNDFSFLASDDEWTSPIAADVGPDGALWMIDWYNFIIQHNPIPRGFQKGSGNAYETPLRDKTHGRVYRLVWDGAKPAERIDLSNASPARLVEALKSDNLFWRMTAQRLLADRGEKGVIPELIKLVDDPAVDAVGLNPAAIHALWTMENLGAMDGSNTEATAAAARALRHKSAGVRRAALDVLPRTTDSVAAILEANGLGDPDLHVRKSALLALSEMPASQEAGGAIFSMLQRSENAQDSWITDAATIAACKHDIGFQRAVFAAYKANAPGATAQTEPRVNLITNGSFEKLSGRRPAGWSVRNYSGEAAQRIVDEGHTGSRSVEITSSVGADTSWFTDVTVEPQTDYRLSGWIKTENLQTSTGLGALFNVHGTDVKTPAVLGTHDWQKVEVKFNSGGRSRVSINCLFGGWGHATGTAWYDDVELVKVGQTLPGKLGQVIGAVINHYARRGPADSVVGTLSGLEHADPQLSAVVIGALAEGWPQGRAPNLSEADISSLHEVMNALPAGVRDRMLALANRWGRRDLFASEIATITAQLRATLADPSADPDKRLAAGKGLVSVDDGASTIEAILKQINVQSPPDLQTALLRTVADSKDAAAGTAIVSHYKAFTPASQRAALSILLRKPAWAREVLQAVEAGGISGADLKPEDWQLLTRSDDTQLAEIARKLEKSSGRAPTADRKQIVEKLLPLASKPGDPARGRLVFEQNCMVCHTIQGKGGQVGPDLTGIGHKPKAENLIDILDPNRSVEGTYRAWNVVTKDGNTFYGRLAKESRTSVEIIDTTGSHVIQRSDIKSITGTDRSIMPDGFEALPPDDLCGVLEYLAHADVKR